MAEAEAEDHRPSTRQLPHSSHTRSTRSEMGNPRCSMCSFMPSEHRGRNSSHGLTSNDSLSRCSLERGLRDACLVSGRGWIEIPFDPKVLERVRSLYSKM